MCFVNRTLESGRTSSQTVCFLLLVRVGSGRERAPRIPHTALGAQAPLGLVVLEPLWASVGQSRQVERV